jgi:hypothetical protein
VLLETSPRIDPDKAGGLAVEYARIPGGHAASMELVVINDGLLKEDERIPCSVIRTGPTAPITTAGQATPAVSTPTRAC